MLVRYIALMARLGHEGVMISFVIAAFGTIISLCLGSFFGVVITRSLLQESIVHPRSHCDECRHALAWYDLVPMLSFAWLKGRCRYCKTPLSLFYPTIEIATAASFLFCYFNYGLTLAGTEQFVLFVLLLLLAFSDALALILPLRYLVLLILLGLIHTPVAEALADGAWLGAFELIRTRLTVATLSGLLMLAVAFGGTWWLRRRGRIEPSEMAMGLGDPVLFFGLGLWFEVQALYFVLFLASLQGTLYALWMSSRSRKDNGQPLYSLKLPLGTFLCLAALEMLVLPSFFSQLV